MFRNCNKFDLIAALLWIPISLGSGGCDMLLGAGVKDVTRYQSNSDYRVGRTYRTTRDMRLQPDGWLGYLGNDPAHPAMDKGDVLVKTGTRFCIDKMILDDRVASLQFHPKGFIVDGPYKGRRIDAINVEEGFAVEVGGPSLPPSKD